MAQCLNLVSLRLNACCVQGTHCSTAQTSTEALLTLRMNCTQQRKEILHNIVNSELLVSFEPKLCPYEELQVTD